MITQHLIVCGKAVGLTAFSSELQRFAWVPSNQQGAALSQRIGHKFALCIDISAFLREGQNNVGGKATVALVEQLIVTVLANRPGGTPQHRSTGHSKGRASKVDSFSVTFHGQLLQKVGELLETMGVGSNDVGIGLEIKGIPVFEQGHHQRKIIRASAA